MAEHISNSNVDGLKKMIYKYQNRIKELYFSFDLGIELSKNIKRPMTNSNNNLKLSTKPSISSSIKLLTKENLKNKIRTNKVTMLLLRCCQKGTLKRTEEKCCIEKVSGSSQSQNKNI